MFYVRMHDKYMSGWGGAKNRRAMYCVECATLDQAYAIQRAAQDRKEMKYITLLDHPPRFRVSDQITWRKFEDLHGPWKTYYREEAH